MPAYADSCTNAQKKAKLKAAQARIRARDLCPRTQAPPPAILILIGSYMEHVTQTDPDKRDSLMQGLDVFLERDRDRELFDLAPKQGER